MASNAIQTTHIEINLQALLSSHYLLFELHSTRPERDVLTSLFFLYAIKLSLTNVLSSRWIPHSYREMIVLSHEICQRKFTRVNSAHDAKYSELISDNSCSFQKPEFWARWNFFQMSFHEDWQRKCRCIQYKPEILSKRSQQRLRCILSKRCLVRTISNHWLP